MRVGCQVLRDDKHLLNGELVASFLAWFLFAAL